ncbi:MAG: 5'-nucleotidase C-terminal domain-containing protein [Clostridia bacterium]
MKKFKVGLLIILVLVLSVVVIGCQDNRPNVTITIYHTNDMHSRFDSTEVSGSIGIDRVASLKKSTKNSLLVDAGDTLHGLPITTLSKGETAIQLMNVAGYDYMATGNHDYNYGLERLLELAKMANFKILAANVVYKNNGAPILGTWDIKTVAGVKMGFFGLATSDTLTSTMPANVKDLLFLDAVEIAAKCVKDLENRGCKVIVGLTHLGDTSINGSITSEMVAKNVEGIDIIIDGHSHSTYEKGIQVDNTLICSTGSYLANVGVVELTIEKGQLTGKKASLITFAMIGKEILINFDMDTKLTLDAIRERVNEITQEIVGKSEVTMTSSRKYARSQEIPLGNFVADVFRAASGADVTIVNGGGLRADLKAGDIRINDVIAIMPFSNTHQVKEITPAILYAAIENGTGQTVLNAEKTWTDQKKLYGKFPQIAGMQYAVDFSKEAGDRVTIWLQKDNGVILDKNDTTRVLTVSASNFMLSGGDGYAMFAPCKTIIDLGTEDQIMVSFFKEHGNITSAPALGRIMFYNGETLLINPLA